EKITADRSLLTVHFFINRGAQLVRVDLSEVLEDNLAVFVVKKSRRHLSVPGSVDGFDCWFRIVDIQKHDRHLGLHLSQEFGHRSLDVGDVVQTDSDEVQTLVAIVGIDFYQIGKLFAAGIAPGRPEVYEERSRVLRVSLQKFFESIQINDFDVASWRQIERPPVRDPSSTLTLERLLTQQRGHTIFIAKTAAGSWGAREIARRNLLVNRRPARSAAQV